MFIDLFEANYEGMKKSKKAKTVYQSMKHASICEKVPIHVIRQARDHKDCPKGAFNTAGHITWDLVGPFIASHREEFENSEREQREQWQIRRIRAEALKAELLLEEKYSKVLRRDDVEAFQFRLGNALIDLFNRKLKGDLVKRLELPPEQTGPVNEAVEALNEVVRNHLLK